MSKTGLAVLIFIALYSIGFRLKALAQTGGAFVHGIGKTRTMPMPKGFTAGYSTLGLKFLKQLAYRLVSGDGGTI